MNHEAVYRTAPATPGLLMILSFGMDKTFRTSSFNWTVVLTTSSKTVLPEVHGGGVEGDDCGARHRSQEGEEPGRAECKETTQTPASVQCQYSVPVCIVQFECQH